MSIPCTFDELKQRPGPPLNAWGLYGEHDELGRLNLITPEAVKRGRDAIKHGICINLNLSLSLDPPISPMRGGLTHEIIGREYCIDSRVSFNTQMSTQWDGFRHFPYKHWPRQGVYTYHGGMTEAEARDPKILKYGAQNYARRPISSRAHLLDVAAYLERHGLPSLSFFDNTTAIPLKVLQECAKESNVHLQPGDILVVRTGWTEAYFALSADEVEARRRSMTGVCGVDQTEEVMRWHWENGIAAVVSDAGAYERYPSPVFPSIHEVFLAGWGLPMGELFDLRELAETCARLKQWTFLFTSMALNIDASIATPPNAQAIL